MVTIILLCRPFVCGADWESEPEYTRGGSGGRGRLWKSFPGIQSEKAATISVMMSAKAPAKGKVSYVCVLS